MENLIFDIGFHKGEDILLSLLKGYRVIAVDADPNLINEWQNIFKKYIENGKKRGNKRELRKGVYIKTDFSSFTASLFL